MSQRPFELTEREWSMVTPGRRAGHPEFHGLMTAWFSTGCWGQTGSSWSKIPERYGIAAIFYNRFFHGRGAGI